MSVAIFSLKGVGIIPRPRLPEGMVRKNLGVRVPEWMIEQLDQLGDRTEHTEKAIIMYLKSVKNTGKKY